MKVLARDMIIAAAVALVISFFIRPTIVRETSMLPTLQDGNYLLISRQAYRMENISRGDIIVFRSGIQDKDGNKELLIKRVIGLPGDVITVAGGVVYRNGRILEEKYIKGGAGSATPGEIYSLKVPEGRVFVMGDNRKVSIDSRYETVGTVKESDIMGKVFLRLYPFDEAGKI